MCEVFIMRIQSFNVVVSRINKSTSAKPVQTKNQTSFKGNYTSMYKTALTSKIGNYRDAIVLFNSLVNAAKTEKGLFKGVFYDFLERGAKEALLIAKKSSFHTGSLLTSTSHKSPLITMQGGVISFHDPEYGEFGAGNINFWLSKNNDLNVSRPKDYRKFYENGGLQESYENYDDYSGIYNHYYYKEDGSKAILKNFFFGD